MTFRHAFDRPRMAPFPAVPGRTAKRKAAGGGEPPSMADEALGRVADVMAPVPVSVSTRDTAATASVVFRRHRLPILPVVDVGTLVGVVAPLDLLQERPYRPVTDLMTRDVIPATPELPLIQAHALFVRQRVEVLPVVQDDRIVGQLTFSAVLRAINQQTDPLTGLPWAAALRGWAAHALVRRREVAMLFVDLDDFREVNKALGHVAGDGVLRTIADLLQQCTNPLTDLLCRYGGDEFAIATLRTEEQARALAARIQEVVAVPVDPATDRRVTASVGYAGGRRHQDRDPGHARATVDDLLALASRASMLSKASADAATRRTGGGAPGRAAPEARARLIDVHLESEGGRSSARVRLRLGSREVVGASSGLMPEPAARFVVAEAALQALHQLIGEDRVYSLSDVFLLSAAHPLVVVALSRGPALSRDEDGRDPQAGADPRRYIGGATAPELPLAVCKAVLDAVNRPLARTFGAMLLSDARE